MAQGIMGGLTSYEEQSLPDILRDISNWIHYTSERKAFMLKQKDELAKSKYWEKIPFDFQLTIITSISYFDTIIHDLELVKRSIEKNRITKREVVLLRNIGIKAVEYNREYGKTYKEDRRYWHDYGNPDFIIAEEMYGKGRDYFVTIQDTANAAYRLEDYMEKGQVINNSLNISGNITGSQIQQGTIGSKQTMSVENNFNYDKVLETLNKIQKTLNSSDFLEDFSENAEQVKAIVVEAIEMVHKKEEPSKIKKALNTLKDLAIGVSGSIIASGIVALISQLPIW